MDGGKEENMRGNYEINTFQHLTFTLIIRLLSYS